MKFNQAFSFIFKIIFPLFFISVSVGCSSLLYYPSDKVFVEPSQLKLSPQEIFIETANGNKIHSWLFKNRSQKKPKAVFLHFHGNAQNITSHFLALTWILEAKKPYDFLIFDYEGYGKSEGSPSPKNTVEDGKAALRHLKNLYPTTPLIVFGQSLGGAVALRTAIEMKDEVPVDLVIVESSFKSYQDAGASLLAKSWLTWLFQGFAYLALSDRYAPESKMKNLSPIPLLVIHGNSDPIIDIQLGRELYEAAADPKEFWEVEGGGHINSFFLKDSHWRDRLLVYVDEKLASKILPK